MTNEKLNKNYTDWWKDLQKNMGGKAQLKRCKSPEEALLLSETLKLKWKLPNWVPIMTIATIASLSAHIKSNSKYGLNASLAKRKNKRLIFSERNFCQLIDCQNWVELHKSLRRALNTIKGQVNLTDFITTMLLWDDAFKNKSHKNESIKFKLSVEYYKQSTKKE